MTEREKILGRIREALTVTAPPPGEHGPDTHPHAAGEPIQFAPRAAATNAREWLPKAAETFEAQVAQFRACSDDLKTEFIVAGSLDELPKILGDLRQREGWKQAAAHKGELTDAAVRALDLPTLTVDGGYDVHALERCDVGITECDALVAQTGTLVVNSRTSGGRALSVLPPHHLVIARSSQLVADLPAAFELIQTKYGADYPSMISLVTGPSRTGDIERILVLGAHGPKKLTVVMI
jgi:L-lactate dehydrogenase complex protein LldG